MTRAQPFSTAPWVTGRARGEGRERSQMREVQRYTDAADQARLARAAMARTVVAKEAFQHEQASRRRMGFCRE
jgi:hypothetical protein